MRLYSRYKTAECRDVTWERGGAVAFGGSDDLTSEQRESVTFDRRRELLIKGPAGSGKTVVLILRAHELSMTQGGDGRFLTYANTLVKSTQELANRVLAQSPHKLEVSSYHRWCGTQLSRLGIHLAVVPSDDAEAMRTHKPTQSEHIAAALAETRGRTYRSSSRVRNNNVQWWREEIAWIKGVLLPDGRPITSLQDYLDVRRIGRGPGLQRSAREIVWDVFSLYQEKLVVQGNVDWEDLSRTLLEHYRVVHAVTDYRDIDIPPSHQTDHLLIDEAQDLHQLELLALARFAGKTLTLVADEGQKIYKTTFSWESVGLTFDRGNIRTFDDNFRSTKQIVELALPLRPQDPTGGPLRLPRREGPLPLLYKAKNSTQEDEIMRRVVVTILAQNPHCTICVPGRTWQQLRIWEAQLRTAGCTQVELLHRKAGSTFTPGVKLTTLLGVKGLEFDAVVIPRLTEGIFPIRPAASHADTGSETAEDLKEHYDYEQRLLYVAMTRARRELALITSGEPSRFLDMLDSTKYQVTVVG